MSNRLADQSLRESSSPLDFANLSTVLYGQHMWGTYNEYSMGCDKPCVTRIETRLQRARKSNGRSALKGGRCGEGGDGVVAPKLTLTRDESKVGSYSDIHSDPKLPTRLTITDQGRAAFVTYLDAIEKLLPKAP